MAALIPRALGILIITSLACTVCGRRGSPLTAAELGRAAESYVRLVLALGERDADSLDGYHGPPSWQAEARDRHAALADVQRQARALADGLASRTFPREGDEVRRAFLIRQLGALVSRIDILSGARPSFADEARLLFGLDVAGPAHSDVAVRATHAAVDRELPGEDGIASRVAAFERRFLIPPDRLPAVMARAIQACRSATRAHVELPATERVDVTYVRDLAWSAFTRYEGRFRSTIQINAGLPLTVDRALDLACHEAYPGHHTIGTLLETKSAGRIELLVQATFSPQSLLHESASSVGGTLAFDEPQRVAFERDVLFPLAGLNPADAERHVRVARLVDRLHGVEAEIVRRYLDGELDFPRASLALERDALMPSADVTLKFVNRFRSYAATYTIGRDLFWKNMMALKDSARGSAEGLRDDPGADEARARWRAYVDLVTNPEQALAPGR
jgi:hypothetical protein